MLTEENRREIQEWIHLHSKSCPLCSGEWLIHDDMMYLPLLDGKKPKKDEGFVVYALMCRGCGYTIFVSAVLLKQMSADATPKR